MKSKLLTVLNQCVYNKSIADFDVIMELISIVSDDKTRDFKLSHGDIGVYVSMLNNGKLCSIMLTDNNELMFSLPDDIGKTYVIENCSYNIKYNEIKSILSYK